MWGWGGGGGNGLFLCLFGDFYFTGCIVGSRKIENTSSMRTGVTMKGPTAVINSILKAPLKLTWSQYTQSVQSYLVSTTQPERIANTL